MTTGFDLQPSLTDAMDFNQLQIHFTQARRMLLAGLGFVGNL